MSRILIVDDDPVILTTLQKYLSIFYTVDATNNPIKAVNMIKTTSYDCVVTDLNMPKLTGVELFKTARNIYECKTPFILITSYETLREIQNTRIYAHELGFDAYYAKPVDKHTLKEKIDGLIDIKKRGENVKKE